MPPSKHPAKHPAKSGVREGQILGYTEPIS